MRRLLEADFKVRALVRSPEKGGRARSLGAEIAVGDVREPRALQDATTGCSGVFSALAAGPGRGGAEEVEYAGNMNLLRAAKEEGAERFVYVSALMADHPLARGVGELREKARFEEELFGSGLSVTALRPAMLMETLLLALQGNVAFVPGKQRNSLSWISADDVARAAVRAFGSGIEGRHELASPERYTFDEAYERIGRIKGRRIRVLHPPIITMRAPGLVLSQVGDLARMFDFFDRVGYATDPAPLRDLFEIEAVTLEEWAERVFREGVSG